MDTEGLGRVGVRGAGWVRAAVCGGMLLALACATAWGTVIDGIPAATADVMVVYTPAARRVLGGSLPMLKRLMEAVEFTNAAFERSGIHHRIRLVHTEEIAYTEATNPPYRWPGDVDFERFRDPSDGFMDEVFDLIEAYRPDIVFLMTGWGSGGKAGGEFGIFGVDSFHGPNYYTFAHEVGHLFWANHAVGDTYWGTRSRAEQDPPLEPDPEDGDFIWGQKRNVNHPYAHAHNHFEDGIRQWRTIMGYGGSTPDDWREGFANTSVPSIPHFSNPDILYDGVPTGIENMADNARLMRQAGPSVAAIREELPPEGSPSGVITMVTEIDIVNEQGVHISWNPMGGVEYAYRVYRREGYGLHEPLGFWQNSTSFLDATGEPGITYQYAVRAYRKGITRPGNLSSPADGSRERKPPRHVNASDGTFTDRVRVSWEQARSPQFYRVYRSETLHSEKIAVSGWQSATTFDDTAVPLAAHEFFYWVRAAGDIAGSGASDFSEPNGGHMVLVAPSGVAATDGSFSSAIMVQWDSVPGATHYRVRRTATPGSSQYIHFAWQTGTTYADTAVETGITYEYWVQSASNAQGTSPSAFSAADFGWRQLDTPGDVQTTFHTRSDGVQVQWTPLPRSMYYVPHYQVRWSGTGDSGESGWMRDVDSYLAQTTPGANYLFSVRASRSGSGADPTDWSSDHVGARLLSAPGGVQASKGTYNDRIVVDWSPVPGASHYRITASATRAGTYEPASAWQTATSFTHFVAAGVSRYYRVQAATDASGGYPGELSAPEAGESGLPAPDHLAASKGDFAGLVQLTWSTVPGSFYYQVYRATSPDGTQTALTGWGLNATTYNDSTASPGQVYTYWVRAAQTAEGGGTSAYSAPATGFRTLPAPARPDVSEGTIRDGIHVQWAPLTEATHYQVSKTDAPGGVYTTVTGWITSTEFMDPNGDPGHTYYYRVKAAASAFGQGESEWSTAYGGFKMMSPPSPVTAAKGAFSDKVRVWWQNGSNMSYVMVYRGDSPGGPMEPLTGWIWNNKSYDDTTAASGRIYYYQVAGARGPSGYGATEAEGVAAGWIRLPVPGRPFVSDAEYGDRIEVSWRELADGAYYRVWRKDSPSDEMEPLSAWQTAASYADVAVDAGHTYYYAIQAANNAAGDGATALGQLYGGSRRIAPPVVLAARGEEMAYISVYWSSVPNATYYKVLRARASDGIFEEIRGWDRGHRFEDYAAEQGVVYEYVALAARGMTGYGQSDSGAVATGWLRPVPPTGVEASDGTHLEGVEIAWDSPFAGAYHRVWRADALGDLQTDLSGWIIDTGWLDDTAEPGVTYYYYVQACMLDDGTGAGLMSEDETGWRGILPPAAPVAPPVPPDFSVGVDLLPTLEWIASDGATHYGVEIWSNMGRYRAYFEEDTETWDSELNGLTELRVTLPQRLRPNTVYHWQVFASNAGGETEGPVWEFTTKDMPFHALIYGLGYGGLLVGEAIQTVYEGEHGSAVEAVGQDDSVRFHAWSDGRTDNPRRDFDVQGQIEVQGFFRTVNGGDIDWYTVRGLQPGWGEKWSDVDQRLVPGKGTTYLQENIADTDPGSPDDQLQITRIEVGPPLRIHFNRTSTERVYTLHYAEDLLSGFWTPVPGAFRRLGQGGEESMEDSVVVSRRYYRVSVELP